MNKQKNDFPISEVIASGITLAIVSVSYFDQKALTAIILLFAMFFWVFLPLFFYTLFSLIDTLFLRKRARKILLPIHFLIALFLVSHILPSTRLPSNKCGAEEMVAYYDKHEPEFQELKSYIYTILPDSCAFHIEFENGKMSICHVYNPRSNPKWNNNWNEDAAAKGDSLLLTIGINPNIRETLRQKLKKLCCISVDALPSSVSVGYKRILLGKYDFLLFRNPLSPEEIEDIKNDYTRIYYRDNVALEYGSGAVGSMGFPGKEEYEKNAAGRIP
ncbi:MAG: hypothetical protein LBN29_02175 [Mediterranea sp.]|jgi:hypothetical protein|nr:hypothetical protein [Mediterranea sp.]